MFCVTLYLESKSYKKAQAKFRQKYNSKNFQSKSLIFKWVKSFKQLDNFTTTKQSLKHQQMGEEKTAKT